jgi:hypothetical protein
MKRNVAHFAGVQFEDENAIAVPCGGKDLSHVQRHNIELEPLKALFVLLTQFPVLDKFFFVGTLFVMIQVQTLMFKYNFLEQVKAY